MTRKAAGFHGIIALQQRLACTAIAGVGLACTPAGAAESPDLLNDSFFVALSSYVIDDSTEVRLDGKAGDQGTNVDWEKTFGKGDVTRFRLDGQWRFADRHKVRALWFNSARSGDRTIDREIEWGDEVFPVNAKVKGDVDYDIYELAYDYSFMRRESYEVSASIGAYYAQWNATLKATNLNTGGSGQKTAKGDASLDVPLPVIGLRGLWSLPYDLWIDVSGQWFALSVNEYSGNLQDYRLNLTWQPKPWLGLGIGYDRFSAHGDVDATDFRGTLDWVYQGPMLYYSASF